MGLDTYETQGFYDELFSADNTPRPSALPLLNRIQELGEDELHRRQEAVEIALRQLGITFTVYSEAEGTERILPFDLIPRIVEASDWSILERGLQQRVQALNAFLNDVYSNQKVIKDKIMPEHVVASSAGFRTQLMGMQPPLGVWCHVSGTDIIRDNEGNFLVLEDNVRCPSGVSYVLENRQLMKRTLPRVFETMRVRPVDDYPNRLLDALMSLASPHVHDPNVVVLTPGIYNSAYFEHSFLAKQMGVELVEGGDLVVENDRVFMRTTQGFERVDVIYRRVDDDFLDPLVFNEASLLGVPGIIDAYRKGHVALANAPGAGVADDKVVYPYVPKFIEYYLSEEPILHNVPTYVCWDDDDRKYVLENLDSLVVKAANESGGYGMLIGPHASQEDRDEFARRIQEQPRGYIAQPTISLSRAPTLVDGGIEGRHVDLRPYTLCGDTIYVEPGGLTRVALRKGSLVVNSSQGGGTKDTWVLVDESGNGRMATETVK